MDTQLLHDIIQQDTKSWSKALLFWDEKVNWSAIETCLQLGAREGGLSLWLALKNKQVVCADVALPGKAQQLHAKYKVADKIEYEEMDATGIPYENYFDLIISKSVLGSIGNNSNYTLQEQAINEMYKALKPGGKLLFAENLRVSALHGLLRIPFQHSGDKERHLSMQEINTLMRKFSSVDVKNTGFLPLFGKSDLHRNTLVTADEKLLDKLVPQDWHYIAYGIAEK